MNNGDYLICGNDNGNVSFDPFSGTDCTISGIMARDWKVNHIGDCGTVTLSFDMTGVSGFTGNDLHVLIDRDGDGLGRSVQGIQGEGIGQNVACI